MRTSKKTSRQRPRAARPSDSTAMGLEWRIAELERLVGGQREQLAQQQQVIAAQGQRLAALDANSPAPADAHPTDAAPRRESGGEPSRRSRRTVLKLGGIAAAASAAALTGAAATELARPGVAHAAGGVTWATGTVNADILTHVVPVNNLSFPDPALLDVTVGSNSTAPAHPVTSANSAAIAAYDVTPTIGQSGLYATSINGTGVRGQGDNQFGVSGISSSGTGLNGVSNTGFAVQGNSANGIAAHFMGGTAQLLLEPATTAGAPTSGTHTKGEIFLDANAAVWVCVASGPPGTWVGLATSATLHGAINYLSSPTRLLDARSGSSSGLVNRGPLGPLETFLFTVTGLAGIPGTAKGLIANVTVLGPTASGNLSLFPGGTPGPTVASMTFGQPGLFLANGVNVAIGGVGTINIQNQSSGTTPLVLDAVAYVS
jgi:hypothetical protein